MEEEDHQTLIVRSLLSIKKWGSASVDSKKINACKTEISKEIGKEFPKLTQQEITKLTDKLIHVAGHHSYGEELRASQESKTNKRHIDTQMLLASCNKAWISIGKKKMTNWQDVSSKNDKTLEPPAFTLARIVAHAATGRTLNTELTRQAKQALKIKFE